MLKPAYSARSFLMMIEIMPQRFRCKTSWLCLQASGIPHGKLQTAGACQAALRFSPYPVRSSRKARSSSAVGNPARAPSRRHLRAAVSAAMRAGYHVFRIVLHLREPEGHTNDEENTSIAASRIAEVQEAAVDKDAVCGTRHA